MSEIILHSLGAADGARHFSPHVWKVILALRHKGLAYRLNPLSFQDIPKIAGGGFRSVPVLEDGDHVETDSFAIALYLDRAYPDAPGLFPGPGQRALARMVEHHCDTTLNPPLSIALTRAMHDLMTPADQSHYRATRMRRFGESIEQLETRANEERARFIERLSLTRTILAGQPWLSGEQPAFADHVLFGTLRWQHVCVGESWLEADDPVEDWLGRCEARYGLASTHTGGVTG